MVQKYFEKYQNQKIHHSSMENNESSTYLDLEKKQEEVVRKRQENWEKEKKIRLETQRRRRIQELNAKKLKEEEEVMRLEALKKKKNSLESFNNYHKISDSIPETQKKGHGEDNFYEQKRSTQVFNPVNFDPIHSFVPSETNKKPYYHQDIWLALTDENKKELPNWCNKKSKNNLENDNHRPAGDFKKLPKPIPNPMKEKSVVDKNSQNSTNNISKEIKETIFVPPVSSKNTISKATTFTMSNIWEEKKDKNTYPCHQTNNIENGKNEIDDLTLEKQGQEILYDSLDGEMNPESVNDSSLDDDERLEAMYSFSFDEPEITVETSKKEPKENETTMRQKIPSPKHQLKDINANNYIDKPILENSTLSQHESNSLHSIFPAIHEKSSLRLPKVFCSRSSVMNTDKKYKPIDNPRPTTAAQRPEPLPILVTQSEPGKDLNRREDEKLGWRNGGNPEEFELKRQLVEKRKMYALQAQKRNKEERKVIEKIKRNNKEESSKHKLSQGQQHEIENMLLPPIRPIPIESDPVVGLNSHSRTKRFLNKTLESIEEEALRASLARLDHKLLSMKSNASQTSDMKLIPRRPPEQKLKSLKNNQMSSIEEEPAQHHTPAKKEEITPEVVIHESNGNYGGFKRPIPIPRLPSEIRIKNPSLSNSTRVRTGGITARITSIDTQKMDKVIIKPELAHLLLNH